MLPSSSIFLLCVVFRLLVRSQFPYVYDLISFASTLSFTLPPQRAVFPPPPPLLAFAFSSSNVLSHLYNPPITLCLPSFILLLTLFFWLVCSLSILHVSLSASFPLFLACFLFKVPSLLLSRSHLSYASISCFGSLRIISIFHPSLLMCSSFLLLHPFPLSAFSLVPPSEVFAVGGWDPSGSHEACGGINQWCLETS